MAGSINIDSTGAKKTLDGLAKSLAPSSQKALGVFCFSVMAMAQIKSPVDTGRFRAAWQMQAYHGDGSIAGMEVSNNTKYAGVLEYGSPVGGRPWPSAGPLTVVKDGRVYSKQAPGGVLTPELENLAEKAAEAVLRGIIQ